MTDPDLDVAIVGDGPAGLALAAACRREGLAVVVVGGGAPWRPTYGMWRDEVPDVPGPCFRHVSGRVIVHGHRRHEIERAFAIVDNDALRAHFASGVDVRGREGRTDRALRLGQPCRDDDRRRVDARLAVDATGSRRPGRTRPDRLRHRRRRAAARHRAGHRHADGPPRATRRRRRPADVLLRRAGRRRVARRGDRARGPATAGAGAAARATRRPARSVRAADHRQRAARSSGSSIPLDGPPPPRRRPVVDVRRGCRVRPPGHRILGRRGAAGRPARGRGDRRHCWSPAMRWPRPCGRCRCGSPGACTATASRSSCGSTPVELAAFFDAFFELPVATLGAVPAPRRLAGAGHPDDGGAAAAGSPVGAASPGGEPVRRALTDLRTASTQPTATATEKMNHCTA